MGLFKKQQIRDLETALQCIPWTPYTWSFEAVDEKYKMVTRLVTPLYTLYAKKIDDVIKVCFYQSKKNVQYIPFGLSINTGFTEKRSLLTSFGLIDVHTFLTNIKSSDYKVQHEFMEEEVALGNTNPYPEFLGYDALHKFMEKGEIIYLPLRKLEVDRPFSQLCTIGDWHIPPFPLTIWFETVEGIKKFAVLYDQDGEIKLFQMGLSHDEYDYNHLTKLKTATYQYPKGDTEIMKKSIYVTTKKLEQTPEEKEKRKEKLCSLCGLGLVHKVVERKESNTSLGMFDALVCSGCGKIIFYTDVGLA